MDLPVQALELLGALALAVPLTARTFRARANAAELGAAAEKIAAEAVKKAVEALEGTIRALEARATSVETRHADCEIRVDGLVDQLRKTEAAWEHQAELDRELIEKISARNDTLEAEKIASTVEATKSAAVIRGMRVELDDMNRVLKTGRGFT